MRMICKSVREFLKFSNEFEIHGLNLKVEGKKKAYAIGGNSGYHTKKHRKK